MNERELIKSSGAYKIIKNDRERDMLSHAYLIVCQDELKLRTYLKYFASLIFTDCGNERADRLILSEKYSDCNVFPEEGKNIVVATVSDIIEQSLIKPLEADKRVFILSDCQNMNTSAQNKLLKTLEEPPKNVIILLGTTREYSLLPTIKSRVKILEIPLFSKNEVESYLTDKFGEREDIELIASASGGLLGRAEDMAGDNNFRALEELAFDLTVKMKTVGDILEMSEAVSSYGKKLKEFLSVLKIIFRDILMYKTGGQNLIINSTKLNEIMKASLNFDTGAVISAIEKINIAEQDLFYNANTNMQIESVLLSIMEGKYKWQKL